MMLEKLLGRTVDALYCGACNQFTVFSLFQTIPNKCSACKGIREQCTITIHDMMGRPPPLPLGPPDPPGLPKRPPGQPSDDDSYILLPPWAFIDKRKKIDKHEPGLK